ncbi:MAG TPA: hypothetical protein VF176_10620 [Solirubrobacterales bacterium]
MLGELHRRGEERREAGAFLLGRREGPSRLVSRIVYLDDIDPKCLVGGIHLHGEAYAQLWDICEEEDMRVLGDIHTHPQTWVGQSRTDKENPMVARNGHIALIAPKFATGDIKAADLGVHEYRGEEGWDSHFDREARQLIYVGRFA